jgi:nucleotide sugar dehydrogenase
MNDEEELVARRREQKVKLGIVGFGFVGKAVEHAFSLENTVDKMVVDPKYNKNTLEDLCDWQPHTTFICLPTPSKKDGSIDHKAIDDTVMKLINRTDSFIVIKSTVTPDVIERLTRIDSRIVYEPEFVSEANAKADFLNPQFRLIGATDPNAVKHLEGLYNYASLVSPCQTIQMSPVEASFFKYAINNYLSMKVTFMNQLKAVMDDYGGSFHMLSRALPADRRVGPTHMRIPGTDGKPGFGGACFGKDLTAFINFVEKKTKVDPALLKQVKSINDGIRSQYELSEREKEQNVNYGQAKKEQQDQDDGGSKSK